MISRICYYITQNIFPGAHQEALLYFIYSRCTYWVDLVKYHSGEA